MDIAKKILDVCKVLNITPNKLATMADIPRTTIQDIVNGKNKNPQINTIEKICNAVDLTLVRFFMDENPEFQQEALVELNHYKQYLRYKYNLPNK